MPRSRIPKWTIVAVASVLVAGTIAVVAALSWSGFDHDEHLIGPYHLIAVDTLEDMSVSYDLGGDVVGRINETVFAVGFNERWLVAKQHPKSNRAVTNFFMLDLSRDSQYADPSVSVTGPLSEAEFIAKKAELGLPEFSRFIRSLQ